MISAASASALVDAVTVPSDQATAAEKRAALAAVVSAVLGRHDEQFLLPDRVAQAVDARALLRASESDQRRLMGTPARYAEVLWRGAQSPAEGLLSGAVALAAHTFLVHVYWGAGDGSEEAFTEAMEGADDYRPGLLTALRSLGSLALERPDGSVASVSVEPPQDARASLVPARPSTPGLAGYQHEGAFLITLQ